MSKPAETVVAHFDAIDFLPKEIGEVANHQTDLPRIAKDSRLVAAIEATLAHVPTRHNLFRQDSRMFNSLPPESVQLVVTSPPYWTLKEYNANAGQMAAIEDYDSFLDELDKVWRECFRVTMRRVSSRQAPRQARMDYTNSQTWN